MLIGAACLLLLGGASAAMTTAFVQVPGSPFGAGSRPYSLAFTAGGGLLASANYIDGTVSMFSVNSSTGALTQTSGSPFAAGNGPVSVDFSPGGGLLAVSNLVDGTVSVFSVDTSNGAVTQVPGSPFATGNGPRSVAFSPGGGLVAIANSFDATVSVFSVNSASGALAQVPGSPFATGSDPLSVAFNPSGSLLVAANALDATVSVFSVDPASGVLTQVPGSPFAAGAQPYSVAFSPGGGLLAAANSADSTVSVFSVDPTSGALAQAPGSPFAAGASPLSVAFSPGGGLLATANNGGGDVSVFSVDPATGALTQLPGSPFTSGSQTHAVAFSPSGGLLAAANAGANGISMFSLPPPTATVTSPAPGARFALGQRVPTVFSCADGAYGPGIASCTDGSAAAPAGGVLNTSKVGAQTYTVTAKSKDGLTGTVSIAYTVFIPVPTPRRAPVVGGTRRFGRALSCSTGSWTGRPTSYSYQWTRGGIPIGGANHRAYRVRQLDQGSILTCRVTASNLGGAGPPAVSRGVLIAVSYVRGCPAATGRISGATLGLIRLGMTRAQARFVYRHSTSRRSQNADSFCLTPRTMQVGYATPSLLSGFSRREQRQLQGRVIWASTSNPYYSFAGIRTGEALGAVEERMPYGTVVRLGLDVWYIMSSGSVATVLSARDDVVREVGIVDGRVLRGRETRLVVLESFG